MNLKEAFRYQRFLDQMMNDASRSLCERGHMLKTTKRHLIKTANPDAEDKLEEVDEGEFFPNDLVIRFMERLVNERMKLTTAIGQVKCNLTGSVPDIDAAIEANKFRQEAARQIKTMLRTKATKSLERGTGYKFNAEGTQVPYVYDIEVETTENFNRSSARAAAKTLLEEADKTSAGIDKAMVNAQVNYNAPWDVNDGFEDVMAAFEEEVSSEPDLTGETNKQLENF